VVTPKGEKMEKVAKKKKKKKKKKIKQFAHEHGSVSGKDRL
jgi:hypothetical protein